MDPRVGRRGARGARAHAAAVQPLPRPHGGGEPARSSPASTCCRATSSGERAERLLAITRLARFVDRRADALSGGMYKKLALACALLHEPRVLLLDEPTNGVDPVSRRELWALLHEFVQGGHGGAALHARTWTRRSAATGSGWSTTGGCSSRASRGAAGRLRRGGLRGRGGDRDGSRRCSPRCPRSGRVPGRLAAARGPRRRGARRGGRGARAARRRAAPGGPELRGPVPVPPAAGARRVNPGHSIEAAHLTRRFGDFMAVDDVSFEVEQGEIFGYLGANGAGKSTTIRMLIGLLAPTGGRATRGRPRRGQRARRRVKASIGYMSQKFSLYLDLPVGENLLFFGGAYGLWGTRRCERAPTRSSSSPASAEHRERHHRRRCPAASGSGWRWAAPSSTGRASSSSTSPPPASTRWPAAPSGGSSASCPRGGHHGLRHHPLPRRGRVLPAHRAHGGRPAGGARHAGRAEARPGCPTGSSWCAGRNLARRRGGARAAARASAPPSPSAPGSTCASTRPAWTRRRSARRSARPAARGGLGRGGGAHARGRLPGGGGAAAPAPAEARAVTLERRPAASSSASGAIAGEGDPPHPARPAHAATWRWPCRW